MASIIIMARSMALGLAVAAGAPGMAVAEPICVERERLVEYLAREFGEVLSVRGERSRGGMLELFVREDGASWTLAITMPDGAACVVDAGHDWQGAARRPTGPRV